MTRKARRITQADYRLAGEAMARDIAADVRNIVPPFKPRNIPAGDVAEIVNLYHTARTALAGGVCTRYDRMVWAAREYAKTHPKVTQAQAYLDLDGALQ